MEDPKTNKGTYWKGFLTGSIAVMTFFGLIFGTIKGIAEVKEIFWANPQILNAQNCTCLPWDGGEVVKFELLVSNPSSKNCSVIEVNLIWPDGLAADIDTWGESITLLPKTIVPGSSETIKMRGNGHKRHKASATDWTLIPEGKLVLRPDQSSVEATALVKFNTGYIAEKKITLAIERN